MQRTSSPTAGMEPIIHQTSTGVLAPRTESLRVTRCADIETIDPELRLLANLRRAARERGGPLPSIGVAGAFLDERREWTERVTTALAG